MSWKSYLVMVPYAQIDAGARLRSVPRNGDVISIVTVSDDPSCYGVAEILGSSPLAVLNTCAAPEALATVRRRGAAAVLCDELASGISWRALLEELQRTQPSPAFILTSRLADERLWAEVLNLGGFDLLPRPFDREEVTRVIHAAIRQMKPMFDWRWSNIKSPRTRDAGEPK